MGGEGKVNTRRGMGSSAAGRIQHSQDIYWQARLVRPGLVRPATIRSYRLLRAGETKPTRECCKPGALDPPLQHIKMPVDCYKKRTRAMKSVWCEWKTVELQRVADRNNMKVFYNGLKEVWGPTKKGPVHMKSTDGMETFSDSKRVVARWVNTSRSYSKSLATYITKLRTPSRSALPRQASMRFNHS